jgi:hypothetical protein
VIARVIAFGFVGAVFAFAASAAIAQAPLRIPAVREALVHDGYPAREQCGQVTDPSSVIGPNTRPARLKYFSACWVVIEHKGYSVSVVPYRSASAARLGYRSTHNRWATTTRDAVIGHVVLRAFRLPQRDWMRVSRAVSLALTVPHR